EEAVADLDAAADGVLTNVRRLDRAKELRLRAGDVLRQDADRRGVGRTAEVIIGCADAAVGLEPIHDDRGGLLGGDARDVRSAILIDEGGRAARGRTGAIDTLGETADVDVVSGSEAVLAVAEDVVVEADARAELLVVGGLLVERVDRLVLVEASADVE